jgi:hypothetical protein
MTDNKLTVEKMDNLLLPLSCKANYATEFDWHIAQNIREEVKQHFLTTLDAKEQELAACREALELIGDIAIGYDGYSTEEKLKELIDELREIAGKALTNNQKEEK